MTVVTNPGVTSPVQRHSLQLRHWDMAHEMQLRVPVPAKGLWQDSRVSLTSIYCTMTDLGTFVANFRVPGSLPFQSPPSHPNPLKTSFYTRLTLLHERRTGLWEHKAPEEFLHSCPQQPCPQTPHVLGVDTETLKRKTQPPSVTDTKGDKQGFWLGKAGEEQ